LQVVRHTHLTPAVIAAAAAAALAGFLLAAATPLAAPQPAAAAQHLLQAEASSGHGAEHHARCAASLRLERLYKGFTNAAPLNRPDAVVAGDYALHIGICIRASAATLQDRFTASWLTALTTST
jgi:hypothetical protein